MSTGNLYEKYVRAARREGVPAAVIREMVAGAERYGRTYERALRRALRAVTTQEMRAIDGIVRQSLLDLSRDIDPPAQSFGREAEIVNRYVFRHLLKYVRSNGVLNAPEQIAIGVAVPQIDYRDGARHKKQVCKDLVIWRDSGQTHWSRDGRPPLAVLEWKTNGVVSNVDRRWLRSFTRRRPTVGYAVTVDVRRGRRLLLQVARIAAGRDQRKWLLC